jgi:hypothetical protein
MLAVNLASRLTYKLDRARLASALQLHGRRLVEVDAQQGPVDVGGGDAAAVL